MGESPNLSKVAKPPPVANGKHSLPFDPSAPPPFRIGDIRAAIPPHCWIKNPWRFLSYVVRDLVVISALVAAAAWLDTWWVWPTCWVAQGTMFWAVFVLGHDCGNGSFYSTILNSIVGLFFHSTILVPYHGWKLVETDLWILSMVLSLPYFFILLNHILESDTGVPWVMGYVQARRCPYPVILHFRFAYDRMLRPQRRKSYFSVCQEITTYDYIIALREQDQELEQQGVGGQRSPQMSIASSLTGLHSASSFSTAFHRGAWCTPIDAILIFDFWVFFYM